jgi:hypothetical protein
MESFELKRNFKREKMLEELESVEDGNDARIRGTVYPYIVTNSHRNPTRSCRAIVRQPTKEANFLTPRIT